MKHIKGVTKPEKALNLSIDSILEFISCLLNSSGSNILECFSILKGGETS